jgi:hypothetical protein
VRKDGGRSGYGSSLFSHFAIAVISFLFGHIYAVAPTFFGSNCYIDTVAILIQRDESLFRGGDRILIRPERYAMAVKKSVF